MSLQKFIIDLISTQDDRAFKTERNIRYFQGTDIYKYMKTYGIPDDIDITSIQNAIKESIPFVRLKAEKEENSNILIPIINELEKINIPKYVTVEDEARYFLDNLKRIVGKYEEQNVDEEGDWQNIDFFEDYSDFIDQVANHLVILEIGEPFLKKYKKTRKRYNNVINITWENLSTEYKTYLMENCSNHPDDEIELFNISDTCKAYLNCSPIPSIVKYTDCISDIQKEKIEKVDKQANLPLKW